MLKVMVVDDEAPARKRLRDLIERVPDLTLSAECVDGPSAVAAIREEVPDVLFLDVQMPEMDGFDVLQAVGTDVVRSVVFVTAYHEHALAAFDARALDYLLKPFTEARFLETVSRAREARLTDRAAWTGRIEALLAEVRPADSRLAVPSGGGVRFVDVDRVAWIESDGNYVVLHLEGERLRMRHTLKRMAERLERDGFIRIHQSYVVNTAHILELQPWSHGELVVTLRDGTSLVSSRTWSGALREMMGR